MWTVVVFETGFLYKKKDYLIAEQVNLYGNYIFEICTQASLFQL